MGGCRCTFRDCENGTASRKELHFFRYPVRDPDRLKVWTRLANRMEFLDLPKDKLMNKVVCQDHFERSMFMNYLCDRLSRLAIPRLMPQPDCSVLNVETGDISWIDNDNGTVGSVADSCKQPPVQYSTPTQKAQIKIESVDSLQNLKEPPSEPSRKKIKILNSDTLIFGKADTPCKVLRITTSPNKPGHPHNRLPRVTTVRKVCQPKVQLAKTAQIDQHNDDDTHTLLQIEEDGIFGGSTYEQDETNYLTSGTEKDMSTPIVVASAPSLTLAPATVVDPVIVQKVEQNNSEIVQLKQMVQELLDRPPPETQPVTVVTPSAVSTKVMMEKGPHLTKAQLFSSIKRYLNPTMVTLLRMELFSGPSERQWKPDEKSLAVDLHNLGEHVYDHFTEEFRFRLPPKPSVKEWKEAGEIDADDAC